MHRYRLHRPEIHLNGKQDMLCKKSRDIVKRFTSYNLLWHTLGMERLSIIRHAKCSIWFCTLALITMVAAHSPASVPGVIFNSYLPRGFNGTVFSLTSDVNHNVYVACYDPSDDEASSAFMLKLDSKLHTVWRKKFDTLPVTPPTVAFSDTMGLYAIFPMKDSETENIQVWLLELSVYDGKTMQAVQIDSVQSMADIGIKAYIATGERERPTIYVSYVEQRLVQGDTVTKVFKFNKMDSSVLLEQWRTEVYNASQVAVSHEIAEYLRGEGVLVAAITRDTSATATERATITMIDKNGSSTFAGSFPTMTGNAKISCFESDDNGVMYFSESPSYLHHITMTSLNGSYRISKLWSDSSFDIAAMHVLRNGSLLYALANSEEIRNDNSSMFSETVPVFVVYNYTGVNLVTERHNETQSGAMRYLRTFAMKNEAQSPAIVLGGYFRLAGNNGRLGKAQLSLGTYIFPVSAFRAQEIVVTSPVPYVPNPEEEPEEAKGRFRRFAIGISCGISAVVVIMGIVSCLRRRRSSLVSKLCRSARVDRPPIDATTGTFRQQGGLS